MPFRLAHLSDLHIGPLPKARIGELMGKRLLGYLSWHKNRRRLHLPKVLNALAADLQAEEFDHCAITGDLINISLPAEYPRALEYLRTLGPGEMVSVVPGNHDTYVPMPWEDSLGQWQDFFRNDEDNEEGSFPFFRQRGPLAIIGLSSALPTAPTLASGRLGDEQIETTRALLRRAREENLCRVLLMHHPPCPRAMSWRKNLADGKELCQVLEEEGAELVLHGHGHDFQNQVLPGRDGPIHVFGIPSASAFRPTIRPQSHYRVYDVESEDRGWTVKISDRAYDHQSNGFSSVQSFLVKIRREA